MAKHPDDCNCTICHDRWVEELREKRQEAAKEEWVKQQQDQYEQQRIADSMG